VKRFISNLHIRHKILLMSYLVIIISNISTYASYVYLTDSLKSKAYDYSIDTISQSCNRIDLFLEEIKMISFSICANPDLQQFILKNRNYSEYDYQKQYASISRLFALITIPKDYLQIQLFSDHLRMPVLTEYSTAWVNFDYDFHTDEWYRTLAQSSLNSVVITENVQKYFLPRSRRDVVTFAFRIISLGELEPIGYLLVDVNKSYFKNLINIKQTSTLNTLILNGNKHKIYEVMSDKFDFNSVLDFIAATPSGRAEIHLDKRNWLCVYSTSVSTGWKIITALPSDTLLSDLKILPLIFSVMLLTTIAITVFLAYRIAHHITNPIENLITDMKQAKRGHFQLPLPVHSNDESGELIKNYNDMMLEINDLIQRNESMAVLKKEAEFNALQQQMNPHFINNTLEIMIGLACEGDMNTVISICKSLGTMLKYNLQRANIVTVYEEVSHVKNYLSILESRMRGRFTTEYNIDPEVLDVKSLKFIIQPFVENILMHGFKNTLSGGLISIHIKLNGEYMHIKIEDNGCGMDEECIKYLLNTPVDYDPLSDRRIGIMNIYQRLRLYFGNRVNFSIESNPNEGTRILISVPVVL
jgi:two-component system, sensor histidine kinase YesM